MTKISSSRDIDGNHVFHNGRVELQEGKHPCENTIAVDLILSRMYAIMFFLSLQFSQYLGQALRYHSSSELEIC